MAAAKNAIASKFLEFIWNLIWDLYGFFLCLLSCCPCTHDRHAYNSSFCVPLRRYVRWSKINFITINNGFAALSGWYVFSEIHPTQHHRNYSSTILSSETETCDLLLRHVPLVFNNGFADLTEMNSCVIFDTFDTSAAARFMTNLTIISLQILQLLSGIYHPNDCCHVGLRTW